jgi:hypothetical protein
VVGIASDFIQPLQLAGFFADGLSIYRSASARVKNPHSVDTSLDVTVELLSKAAGAVPGIGSSFDLLSLILNLSHAIESTP